MAHLTNCGFAPTAGGTADWTYSAPVTGYATPSQAGAVNSEVYFIRAQSADNSIWEYSYGSYNSSTGVFTRAEVLYNSSGTGTRQSGAGTKINFAVAPALCAVVAIAESVGPIHTATPRGRLTLTSGTPVTQTDVTAATTLYYTSFRGNTIALLDAAGVWINFKFTEVSLSLSGLAVGNYDIFAQQSTATTFALNTLAWTNDTTRATAITQQDGIDVLSGTPQKRLLGTITITATGQTEDSRAKRMVSNLYNDEPRPMLVNDPAATGTQAVSTSWRQANSNTANQLEYVCCTARPVSAVVVGEMVYVPGGGATALQGASSVGIGIDTVPSATQATLQFPANINAMNNGFPTWAYYHGTPGVGRHKILWIEYVQTVNITGGGTGTPTWIYTNLPLYMSGISGAISN